MSGEGTGGVQVTLSLLHLGDGVNKALITLRRNTGRRTGWRPGGKDKGVDFGYFKFEMSVDSSSEVHKS